MRKLLFFSALVLTCLPGTGLAAETVWNMEGVNKLEGWNHRGFSQITLTPDGLLMQTEESQGQLARPGPIRHKVDTITITYSSPTGASGIFFWQKPDQVGNQAYNIPMRFSASTDTTSMVLDLTKLPEWTPNSKLIGFNFNADAQILLKSITFDGPGIGDTLRYAIPSLLTFDEYKSYAVNFLWGPRLVGTPEAVEMMYASKPPLGPSVNIYLYIGLLLVFAVLMLRKKIKHTAVLVPMLWCIAAVWIAYDIRMGAEILSYARADWNMWWSQPIELKDYRDRGSFTAFSKVAQEYAEGEEYYALITPTGWPYFGTLTYETYPALPLALTDDLSGVSLWFVYRMRNVEVNENGALTVDGEAVSPPGQVLLRFEPGSFIFRSQTQ